jgi:hypothetical protein
VRSDVETHEHDVRLGKVKKTMSFADSLAFIRLREPTVSSGQKIDVNFDEYRFDWTQFAEAVSATTLKRTAEQVALYSFATAVVVQKDFGTDHYKRVLSSVADLETHFPVDAEIYVFVKENPPIPLETLKARTKSENVSNIVDRAQIVTLLTRELSAGMKPQSLGFVRWR